MKVRVEVCYDTATRDKKIIVEVKDSLKGANLMNAIEHAIEKVMKDDKEWTRWNLLDIVEVT